MSNGRNIQSSILIVLKLNMISYFNIISDLNVIIIKQILMSESSYITFIEFYVNSKHININILFNYSNLLISFLI